MKQLEKKKNSVGNEKRQPEKMNEKMMKKYGTQSTIMANRKKTRVRNDQTRYVGMPMCFTRAISN